MYQLTCTMYVHHEVMARSEVPVEGVANQTARQVRTFTGTGIIVGRNCSRRHVLVDDDAFFQALGER